MSRIVHPRFGRLSQGREYITESPDHVSGKCKLLPTHWLVTYMVPFPVKDLDLEVSPRIFLRTYGLRTCKLYLCMRTDVEVFHHFHLNVSEVDTRLLEISGTCFSSLLLCSSTWLRASHRSLRNGQLAISSSARFLTMLDHTSCAHTHLTATESDRKSTAFQ